MSNFTDFVGDGSGGGVGRKYVDLIILDKSTTWSPRQDCKAVVTVIGGGGSGGVRVASSFYATGGGAGGLAQSDIIDLSSSTSYTATVGAGGTHASINGSGLAYNGNSGGNSVFSGTGITTLTGNGGAGGSGQNYVGGVGGSASGGLVNYTGGNGGASSVSSVSGGGAVNITGTAYRGGNANHVFSATGGAGCGQNGLDTQQNQTVTSGGKGVLDSVIDFYYLLPESYNLPYPRFLRLRGDYRAAERHFFKSPSMFVGGIGESALNFNNFSAMSQSGGMFAGGGGLIGGLDQDNVGYVYSAGNGGIFGGGGGGCALRGTALTVSSGAGGDGVVFIAVTEYL